MFSRWKESSCVLQSVQEKSESEIQSIHEDIVKVPNIIKLISHLQEIAQNITNKAKTYIQEWNKYKSLWSYEKMSTCEKFVKENKEIVKFDEKFVYYETIVDNLKEHVDFKNIDCIQINLVPLITNIQNHALEWKSILGKSLISYTRERMNGLDETIQVIFVES